ncbi:uncharacterized protein GGS22DRAFT_65405 [Annulohypoxylon maeteangense]|uniref:uncharacterized protein n=1 Tax=Annulohypoxylon maeteangense TaxID=1927788 RepID=UPI002007F945|nr:uncharacterized protein GGS22DRAFT_65405 [Annulohypoxylon maeteangense]KAI0888963.1 hypothetical protein GGS22DRAFT_65405 [Annulohypoxylon maeteangense]
MTSQDIINATSDVGGSSWSFDVSSFLVLLGEHEEVKFRHMRRSLLECFCSVPVAGLQSYLKKPDSVFNATGLQYTSPYGSKTALLRNMKLNYCLESKELLNDGNYAVFSIPHDGEGQGAQKSIFPLDLATACLSLLSWVSTAGIITFLCLYEGASWIGLAGCLILSIYSIILKVAERIYAQPADLVTSGVDDIDAIYILGRRNSCFVLEGSRGDIARMTGQGLRMRKDKFATATANFTRVGTFCVLVFIFAVIPNGTTWDQLAFVALNVLGQLNVVVGQKLNTARFFRKLRLVEHNENIASRTHVYANLIRRFGNGSWVDEVDLLPRTGLWQEWRRAIVNEPHKDAKLLYDQCKHRKSNKSGGEEDPSKETVEKQKATSTGIEVRR